MWLREIGRNCQRLCLIRERFPCLLERNRRSRIPNQPSRVGLARKWVEMSRVHVAAGKSTRNAAARDALQLPGVVMK